MALLVRKNTTFFDFCEVLGGVPVGELWYSGSHDFLRKLKIPEIEIASINQNEYRKEIIIKFEKEDFFKARMDQFGGKIDYIH